jgi:integral membrane protein (TIGR01906 family)
MLVGFIFLITLVITSQGYTIDLLYSLPSSQHNSTQLRLEGRQSLAWQTFAAINGSNVRNDLARILFYNSDKPVYTIEEINHLADVANILNTTRRLFATITFGLVLFLLFLWLTKRTRLVKSWLLGGSIGGLLCLAVFGVLIVLYWETFFIGFHRLLFPPDTWSFPADSSLIILFPEIFWVRYGILNLIVSSIIIALLGLISLLYKNKL